MQRAFDLRGESLEAGFTVNVSTYLQIQFMSAGKTISNVHPNLGRVDGGAGAILYGKLRRTGSDVAFDDRDGVGVGLVGGGAGSRIATECEEHSGQPGTGTLPPKLFPFEWLFHGDSILEPARRRQRCGRESGGRFSVNEPLTAKVAKGNREGRKAQSSSVPAPFLP